MTTASTLRRARVDDAQGIAAVHVAAWQAAYRGLMPDDYLASLRAEARADFWRRALAAEPHPVLVAERAGRIVGFASCGPPRDAGAPADRGELYAIYIDPAVWSSGVGRALCQAALGALRAAGFTAASLWVLAGNTRAIRFYERAGFARDPAATKTVTLGGTTLPELRYVRMLDGAV